MQRDMSKTLNVFAWILLGAMAASLGTGFFLYQANVQRAALAAEADVAKKQAADLAAQSKTLADEANTKLGQASEEVKRAQDLVKQYDDERRMIERAQILIPSTKSKTWKESLNIPLGITLRLPPTAKEQTNEGDFTSIPTQTGSFTDPEPWLRISPYSKDNEQMLLGSVSGTQEALFFSAGKLFAGVHGDIQSHPGYVLRVQSAASSTQLIWMHTAPGIRDADLLDVIASLSFRS